MRKSIRIEKKVIENHQKLRKHLINIRKKCKKLKKIHKKGVKIGLIYAKKRYNLPKIFLINRKMVKKEKIEQKSRKNG